jgi:Concanavalin A-like lectin/glucanases superfamily
MRKYIVTFLILLTLVGSVWGQQNTITPLNQGDILLTKPQRQALYLWLVARAPSYGSSTWYNLAGLSNGTLSGFDGTASSGWSSTSRRGGVGQLNFDGTNDTVSVQSPYASGGAGTFDFRINVPFSIAFWMKTNSVSSVRDIITKGETGGDLHGWWVSILSGNIAFGFKDTSFVFLEVKTTATFNDNLWHSIVVTYNGASSNDATTLAIYVDGIPQGLTTTNAGPLTGAIHTGPLIPILIAPITNSRPYLGALDDIRVYGTVLSQAVISEIARNEISLSQQPFISYAIAAAARVKQKRRME